MTADPTDAAKLAERVLELDAKATPGPWDERGCEALALTLSPGAAREQFIVNVELTAHYRSAAPALARAYLAERDALALTDAALIWFFEWYGIVAPAGDEHHAKMKAAYEAARARQVGKEKKDA